MGKWLSRSISEARGAISAKAKSLTVSLIRFAVSPRLKFSEGYAFILIPPFV